MVWRKGRRGFSVKAVCYQVSISCENSLSSHLVNRLCYYSTGGVVCDYVMMCVVCDDVCGMRTCGMGTCGVCENVGMCGYDICCCLCYREGDGVTFSFVTDALVSYLKTQTSKTPAAFYNLPVIKYEVSALWIAPSLSPPLSSSLPLSPPLFPYLIFLSFSSSHSFPL